MPARLLSQRILWRLLSVSLVCGAWEWAGRKPISLAFPTFSATVEALIDMTLDGSLLTAYVTGREATLQPLVIGILICAFVGVGCGVAMALIKSFEWFTLPVFIIVQSAPMAAIIPLITYLYGIGLGAKVLAVVMMAMPIVVLNSYRGIRNTSPSLIQMSRSFLGTRRQEIVKVIIPSASGMIFAGLRLGVAAGFIGVVLAELLITPTGVGDLITYHRAVAEYPAMFASIASIVVFAAVTVSMLESLEHRLFRPALRGSGG